MFKHKQNAVFLNAFVVQNIKLRRYKLLPDERVFFKLSFLTETKQFKVPLKQQSLRSA
jgi:hypothetical protein